MIVPLKSRILSYQLRADHTRSFTDVRMKTTHCCCCWSDKENWFFFTTKKTRHFPLMVPAASAHPDDNKHQIIRGNLSDWTSLRVHCCPTTALISDWLLCCLQLWPIRRLLLDPPSSSSEQQQQQQRLLWRTKAQTVCAA